MSSETMGKEQKRAGSNGSDLLSWPEKLRKPSLILAEASLRKAEEATDLKNTYYKGVRGSHSPVDRLDFRTIANLKRINEGTASFDEQRDPNKLLASFVTESKPAEKEVAAARTSGQKGLAILTEQIRATTDERMLAKLGALLVRMQEANTLLAGYDLESAPIDRLESHVRKEMRRLEAEKLLPIDQVSEVEIQEELASIEYINKAFIKIGAALVMEGEMGLPVQIEPSREKAKQIVISRRQERRNKGGEIDNELAKLDKVLQTINQYKQALEAAAA